MTAREKQVTDYTVNGRRHWTREEIIAEAMMSDRYLCGYKHLLLYVGISSLWRIKSEYGYEPVGPPPFSLGIIGLMALCALALLLRHPDAG